MISQLPILLFCYIIPGICTPVPFPANCKHRKVINIVSWEHTDDVRRIFL